MQIGGLTVQVQGSGLELLLGTVVVVLLTLQCFFACINQLI